MPPQGPRLKDKLNNRSRIVIEPSDEERAARDVQIQQRGGYLHDTVKIDPFTPRYEKREFEPSMRERISRA